MNAKCPCAEGVIEHGEEGSGEFCDYGEHSPFLTHIVQIPSIVNCTKYTLFYACANHARFYTKLNWNVLPMYQTRRNTAWKSN
jgi:hypothetical protein